MPKNSIDKKNQDIRLKEIENYVTTGLYTETVTNEGKIGIRKLSKHFRMIGRLLQCSLLYYVLSFCTASILLRIKVSIPFLKSPIHTNES